MRSGWTSRLPSSSSSSCRVSIKPGGEVSKRRHHSSSPKLIQPEPGSEAAVDVHEREEINGMENRHLRERLLQPNARVLELGKLGGDRDRRDQDRKEKELGHGDRR